MSIKIQFKVLKNKTVHDFVENVRDVNKNPFQIYLKGIDYRYY